MKIHRAQMQALAASQMNRFVERMVDHLRDNFRDTRQRHDISDAALPELVCNGVRAAARYGVVYEDDVQLYLECLVLLGPGFDRDPATAWAGEILRANYLDGAGKMEDLREHVVFSLEWPLA